MMPAFQKCLALVFSLMILGQAYLVRRYVGTWLFPSCIFGLFWFGYTFFPLAILFWVPVNQYAIAFLFLCTVAFSMGSLAFDWKTAFKRNALKRETAGQVYGSPFLKAVFYVSMLSCLVFVILNMLAQGISFRDFLLDFFASATAYNNLRTPEGLTLNIFDRLSNIAMYCGVILGGFLFPSVPTKNWRRLIVVLSFLPSIIVAVTQSSKWLLFISVAFFYAGILVYRASAGKLRLFEKGSLKSVTLYSAILTAIATISFMSRGLYTADDSKELLDLLAARFASYSCGHLYAFSDWFAFSIGRHSELVYHPEGATYGFHTFPVLFRLMGSHKVVPEGTFDDYYSYGELLTSNIFTMFRGLILDFGIIGSVLFILAAGFLLHWAFHSMLCNRRPVFTVAVFVFATGYSYNSFTISLLNQSSIYFSFVLLWIVLQLNKLDAERGGRRLAMSAEVEVRS
jgi:oligosaccharide repeat unit polymerase